MSMPRRPNQPPFMGRHRSTSGDPPYLNGDSDSRESRRPHHGKNVFDVIRKKFTKERSVSESNRSPVHPPLTKAYTLPGRVPTGTDRRPNHSSWVFEEIQGDSDESVDSGSDQRGGTDESSNSSPVYQRTSIYDEIAVEKAFGPAMKDVGRWFVQEQRKQYMSVEQIENERLGSRPPLPLPAQHRDQEPSDPPPLQRGNSDLSHYGEVNLYDRVHRQPRLLGTNGLQLCLRDLAMYGWYWGPLTRVEAEEKLSGHNDGTFLVRDSSDDRYLLSLSFRSQGKSLHTRIEYCNGRFSFYSFPDSENEGYTSVAELIEKSMQYSSVGVFCFSRARAIGSPAVPVRLLKPLSRLTKVRSLQHYCRFVIRQSIRFDSIRDLPLPRHVHSYLERSQF